MPETPALSVVKTVFDQRAESCLGTMEDALAEVRETPMKAVAVLTLSQAGNIQIGFSCESALELLGALEMMKSDVILRDEED